VQIAAVSCKRYSTGIDYYIASGFDRVKAIELDTRSRLQNESIKNEVINILTNANIRLSPAVKRAAGIE
jgi:hypothetical protein